MKRILIFSAAFLLVVTAIAKEKFFSLEELLQQSDLIVVARLEGSSLKGERLPDSKTFHSWKGQLKVSSVIRGPAKKGENLKLEWMTNMNPICIRPIDHRGRSDQSLIWLLQTRTNGTVRADSPDRVLALRKWWEMEKLLNK